MANMAQTFQADGKVYGLPSRFTVPVLMGRKELVDEVSSPKALSEMVAELQGGEVPFFRVPESVYEAAYDDGVELWMMADFYAVCEGEFFSPESGFDAEALQDWLGDMLLAHEVIMENAPEVPNYGMIYASSSGRSGAEAISMGAADVAEGKAGTHLQTMSGVYALGYGCRELSEAGGMTINSLFGWNKYLPKGGIGVLSSGGQVGLAEAFVETLLSKEVQDVYMYDGFPVNGLSLTAMAEEYSQSYVDSGQEAIDYMGFLELCESLSEPAVPNGVIKAAVDAQLKLLLEGGITPAEAAAAVIADTRLYLAE
jgi:ABC-type glycerol-3-phosphate transport system substrate-binding protein